MNFQEIVNRGLVELYPMFKEDVSINYISSFITLDPGEIAHVILEAGERYYLYVKTVACTYQPDILYTIIADKNTMLYESVEPPSSIGDYNQIFVKPYLCKEMQVSLLNFGVMTRTLQVQIVGWQRPEHLVEEIRRV